MRSTAFFLVAFGLASLAVQGQDAGGNDLLDRIEELTEQLEARLEAQEKADHARRPELRTYEVGDLTQKVSDAVLERANLFSSKYQPPEGPEEPEPCAPFEIDMLIELIRCWVEPESWDMLEGADIQPRNNRLFIRTIPRVHERIGRFLRGLRHRSFDQVAVDLVAVAVTPKDLAELGAHTRELPAEMAARLAAGNVLGSVRLVAYDSQQVVRQAGAVRSYLADYDVEIAQDAAIGKPIRAEVFEGCGVQVRTILDREAQGAILDLRIDRTRFRSPTRRADTDHGPIDLPVMDLTRLDTSLWAPLDRTVVVGGAADAGKGVVFLATVHRLTP